MEEKSIDELLQASSLNYVMQNSSCSCIVVKNNFDVNAFEKYGSVNDVLTYK